MADHAHSVTTEPASPSPTPSMPSTESMVARLGELGHDLEAEGSVEPPEPDPDAVDSDEDDGKDTDESPQPSKPEEKKEPEKLGRVARAKAKITAQFQAKIEAASRQVAELEERDTQWKTAANYAVEQVHAWQERARTAEATLAELGHPVDARDEEIAALKAQHRAKEIEQQSRASAQQRALHKQTAAQVDALKDRYVEEAEVLGEKYGVSKADILRKHVLLAESGFSMEESAQAVSEARARGSAKRQAETNARAPRVALRSTGSTPSIRWSTSTNDMLGYLRSKGHSLD